MLVDVRCDQVPYADSRALRVISHAERIWFHGDENCRPGVALKHPPLLQSPTGERSVVIGCLAELRLEVDRFSYRQKIQLRRSRLEMRRVLLMSVGGGCKAVGMY